MLITHLIRWDLVNKHTSKVDWELAKLSLGTRHYSGKVMEIYQREEFFMGSSGEEYGLDANKWDTSRVISASSRSPWEAITSLLLDFQLKIHTVVCNGKVTCFCHDKWKEDGQIERGFP